MNDFIAGDPAPTNLTARERLVAKVSFPSDRYEADFLAELDAYRAEELQAAADWLMSQGHTIAARDLDRYIDGGESRG